MKLINEIFVGADNRKSLIDLEIPENFNSQVIFFLHGYKGYKDWGCWGLMQQYFCALGYGVCKLNFSYNGGTLEEPIDFLDLTAFSENRYSYEVKDVELALEWLSKKINTTTAQIHLVGHSRGGGIACLTAKNKLFKSLTTLASVSNFKHRFLSGNELVEWKKNGVYYVKNGRTKQNMPHKFSFYQDFIENENSLTILKQLKDINKPCLHIHGLEDKAVPPRESEDLANTTKGKLVLLENTGHTFDTKQPWTELTLPENFECVLQTMHNFYEELRK